MDLDEALRRRPRITARLRVDVQKAVLPHAVLEAGSYTITRGLGVLHIFIVATSVAVQSERSASLAAEGLNTAFDDQARDDHHNAEGYYNCVLDGLKRAAQSS